MLKEVYSTCSLAQIIGAESHQTIDTWAAQYQRFRMQGLKIRHTLQDYGGYFKLRVLNWRKDYDETYQNTAIHFKISSPKGPRSSQGKKAKNRFQQKFKTNQSALSKGRNRYQRVSLWQ
ncbi:hypothetical protein [Lactobacillus sp. B4007]|uniref:hypothetical protein n=1 Tax=Lactobacillus sp. B4007 TaxID=2818032 RepID=UPI00226AA334|nr:hypothetical protein [Lactobacillus sp. B4007]MCX8724524.1 hypothetical protein [Lactobacillus sp. B4007]